MNIWRAETQTVIILGINFLCYLVPYVENEEDQAEDQGHTSEADVTNQEGQDYPQDIENSKNGKNNCYRQWHAYHIVKTSQPILSTS